MIAAEVNKKLRYEHQWMAVIPSRDNYVTNNTINFVDIGADPQVLIDNQTYPIPTAGRTDEDVVVALKKFDTTNTRIKDDEVFDLAYDKEGSVLAQHREVLEEKTSKYGLFSICPSADSVLTPVINTTGADNGSSRKRLTMADVIMMKKRFDVAGIPQNSRYGVLCADHVQDLLLVDQAFRDQYHAIGSGKVYNVYGFQFFEDIYNPIFDASNAKRPWESTVAGTDRNSSVFFYAPKAFKAKGQIIPYMRKAENDPENRESVFGLRLYHRTLPKFNEGFGAIVSASV